MTHPRNQAVAWWNPSGWITGAIVAVLVMNWPKRFTFALGVAGMVALTGHFCGAISFGLRNDWKRLPVSAPERAPLFTQAWLAHDSAAMMRFVRPADEAKLRAWIAANPVPTDVAELLPAERKIKTVAFQRDDADGAVVRVQISSRSASGTTPTKIGGNTAGGFVQRQAWCFSGGNWLFSPDMASTSAGQPAVGPNPTNTQPFVAANVITSAVPFASTDEDVHRPARPPVSSNVVIPSTVPPWARAR